MLVLGAPSATIASARSALREKAGAVKGCKPTQQLRESGAVHSTRLPTWRQRRALAASGCRSAVVRQLDVKHPCGGASNQASSQPVAQVGGQTGMSQSQQSWCEVRGVTSRAAASVGKQEISVGSSRDECKQCCNFLSLDVGAVLDHGGVSLYLDGDAPSTAKLDCITTRLAVGRRILRLAVVKPNRRK